ncbi:hypothetical protein [Chryseobacterium sp. 2R14A]|uniref:hypothetical protein n=1 Tax=Chryseobacterium sp. 2R14A TaxID=3380353 RepID=UPI003CEBF0C3
MKYPKFTALLGLSTLSFHSTFGIGKNHIRLTEEEAQKIEDHLAAEKPDESTQLSELQTKFDSLQNNYNTLNESNTAITTALDSALTLNDLKGELGATATTDEAIALLGTKCKEYGASNNRHSFPNNNGQTPPENGLIDGVVDMNDPHNQI